MQMSNVSFFSHDSETDLLNIQRKICSTYIEWDLAGKMQICWETCNQLNGIKY